MQNPLPALIFDSAPRREIALTHAEIDGMRCLSFCHVKHLTFELRRHRRELYAVCRGADNSILHIRRAGPVEPVALVRRDA